jgi:dipeptidyl aminopeptidase/acylaminoacyl peptidase
VLREEIDFAALPAATPPRVRALLRRCLERDPRLRLRDIGEARIALDPAAPAAVEAAGGASPAAASSALRRWLAVGVAGALVLLGVLAGRASRRAPVPAATVRATLEAPAGWGVHLLNRSLAFSPDGRQLALALSKGGIPAAETQLALRALDRLEATPVAGTGDASYPFWSPDGKAIGFFADGKLKRLDVESGSIRTLCDAPSGRGAAWSPRGTIVLAPVAAGALAEVLAAGGAPRRIACADGAECHQRLPQYLPDGRRVLFYWDRGAAGPEDPATPSGAYVWDPERPEPRLVLAGDSEALYVHPGFLAFVREGNLLVQPFDLERLEASGEPRTVAVNVAFNPSRFTGPYAFSPLGDLAYQTAATEVPRQLAWFDGEGRMSAPIGSPAGYRWLNPSPDGRRALALIGAAVVPHSVWLVDLERGLRTALLPDLTMDVGAWSADGKMIAVALTWAEKIVFQGVDGAMAPREFKAPADSEVLAPLFLPDGSGILFSQRSSRGDKQSDVMLLRFAAGAEPSPLLTGPAIETALSFSPDGRWLLFRSVAPPRRELYVAAFPDVTRRWLLATGTTLSPAWRSNGEVLYADEQGRFFTVALRQRADALEIGAPQPAFGSLRLADRVAPAAYVRARDRLLVATAVGEAEPAPLVLLTGWQGALGR